MGRTIRWMEAAMGIRGIRSTMMMMWLEMIVPMITDQADEDNDGIPRPYQTTHGSNKDPSIHPEKSISFPPRSLLQREKADKLDRSYHIP
jgi:hypothetical protein